METKFNIFEGIVPNKDAEQFETILERGNAKIERIISSGQCTPEGEFYDQSQDEWVMVLKGRAVVSFIDSGERFEMAAGDYLFIPSHVRHRVEYTSPGEVTLWLALHLYEKAIE